MLPKERVQATWDVRTKPDAVVLEGDAARALRRADPAAGRWEFDATTLTDASLVAPGRVVLVAGRSLFRSTEVRREGDVLVVTGEPATLADVVESGTIGWDVELPVEPVFLSGVVDASGRELARREVRPAWAETPRSLEARGLLAEEGGGPKFEAEVTPWPPVWKLKVEPFEYEIRVEPQGDAIAMSFLMKRDAGRGSLAYKAVGTFRNVRSRAGVYYEKGKLVRMTYEQPGMVGDVEVSIATAGGDDLGDFKWQFPGSMFKYLYLVGPVPVTVDVGLDVTGRVTVPASASATAKSGFRYDGTTGFTWKDPEFAASGKVGADAVELTGSLSTLDLTPKPADSAAGIGIPVDAQFGVGFPKAQVSVFDQLLVPYFRPGAVIGSSLSWGPLCKRAYAKFQVDAGVDLKILGQTLGKLEKNLVTREKRAAFDDCPK